MRLRWLIVSLISVNWVGNSIYPANTCSTFMKNCNRPVRSSVLPTLDIARSIACAWKNDTSPGVPISRLTTTRSRPGWSFSSTGKRAISSVPRRSPASSAKVCGASSPVSRSRNPCRCSAVKRFSAVTGLLRKPPAVTSVIASVKAWFSPTCR